MGNLLNLQVSKQEPKLEKSTCTRILDSFQDNHEAMRQYGKIVRTLESELFILDTYNDEVNFFNAIINDKRVSEEDRMIALEQAEILVDDRDLQILDTWNSLNVWYKFILENNIPVNIQYFTMLSIMRKRLGFR